VFFNLTCGNVRISEPDRSKQTEETDRTTFVLQGQFPLIEILRSWGASQGDIVAPICIANC
jgi:hypothetical protein